MYNRDEYEAEQRRLNSLFWHMGEFSFNDQRYLIDGFLPESGLVILAGDPKAGKTALASAIALAVAKGKPFAGMPTKQRGVLWLCLEESHQERSAVMRKARGLKRAPIYITNERIPIDTEEGISDIQHWANEADAGLIVIDPLHAAHSGRSLHDGWSARKTLGLLKEFSKTRTILVLHHLAKRGASRVAESVQLAAVATMVMILRSESGPQTPSREAKPQEHLLSPPPRGRRQEHLLSPPPRGRRQKHLLSPPPCGRRQPRLITLECMGRGEFANRTWQFLSKNPLDFQNPLTTATKSIGNGQAVTGLPAKILELLDNSSPTSAAEIAKSLNAGIGYVRNALTTLRQSRLVIANKVARTTFYRPKRPRKQVTQNDNPSPRNSQKPGNPRT